jgi:hypothetical protein
MYHAPNKCWILENREILRFLFDANVLRAKGHVLIVGEVEDTNIRKQILIIIDADLLNYCSIIHLLAAITTQVMVQGDK